MKKSIKIVTLITALCAFLLAGCATNQSSADSPPITTAVSDTVSLVSNSLSGDFSAIMELRSEGYQSMSLRDFNAAVKTKIDKDSGFLNTFNEFMSSLTVEDSEYQFIYETLNYSINEVIFPQIGEPVSISRYLNIFSGEYTGGANNDETFYDFMFTALYSVEYRVIDETALTLQERDELLTTYQTKLQNALSAMNKKQLTAGGVKLELQKIADNLCADLSTDTIIFENAEIQSIEILDGAQEYQQ